MPGFYHLFAAAAEQYPQQIALEIQRPQTLESHTYAECAHMAECVGAWLAQNVDDGRLPRGARCAILAENQPRWVIAYLGILAAGCTVIPLDTTFRPDQVAKLLKDAGASLIFTDVRHLETTQAAVAGLDCAIALLQAPAAADSVASGIADDLDAMFATGTKGFRPVEVTPDMVASLGYTSGTTSDPKGVMLTHGNLAAEATAVFTLIDVKPDDALLGVLPLFHVLAQMANLLLPLLRGARVVYLETLNTTELMRALRDRNITLFVCVPQFFYLIHERIFREVTQKGQVTKLIFQLLLKINRFTRSLGWNTGKLFFRPVHQLLGQKMKYFVTGGSRFDSAIAYDFYALGFNILQAYGLTETSGCATATPPRDNVIGSVGKPLQGFEVKIADGKFSDEHGQSIGEIAIRGGHVMKGYWNRPDANAEVLRDGWFYSGDLGYLDAQGNLFITGRRKEVIVLSNGKNLYPEEIEAHYLRSPAIKELCIMGLNDPNNPALERLHAVIVPNFEVLRERKIVNVREVIRFDIESLSAQLPSTKRILSYDIWNEDLPRTTTRKLRRFEIEKMVRANQATAGTVPAGNPASAVVVTDEDALWLAQPAVERGLKVIRQAAKIQPQQILPRQNLELDLGLDSMQRIELLMAVEQALGGHVEESRIAELFTVRDLLDTVIEARAGGVGTSGSKSTQFAGWDAVLKTDPTEPEVLALSQPDTLNRIVWYCIFRCVYFFVAIPLFRMKVRGLENLPSNTNFILSPNHQSYLDPVGMVCRLPWFVARNTFAVGTSEIFGMGLMQKMGRSMRVVAVDPDANLIPAMRAGAYGLRSGRNLILYPEGERSIDGAPKLFKKGAAILSIHCQVPIIPIALEGFWESWPRNVGFAKFAPLRVVFGKPIYPPKLEELPADPSALDAEYAKVTAHLKQTIVELWAPLNEESKVRWSKQGR